MRIQNIWEVVRKRFEKQNNTDWKVKKINSTTLLLKITKLNNTIRPKTKYNIIYLFLNARIDLWLNKV